MNEEERDASQTDKTHDRARLRVDDVSHRHRRAEPDAVDYADTVRHHGADSVRDHGPDAIGHHCSDAVGHNRPHAIGDTRADAADDAHDTDDADAARCGASMRAVRCGHRDVDPAAKLGDRNRNKLERRRHDKHNADAVDAECDERSRFTGEHAKQRFVDDGHHGNTASAASVSSGRDHCPAHRNSESVVDTSPQRVDTGRHESSATSHGSVTIGP